MKTKIILSIFVSIIFISCKKNNNNEIDIEPISYLDQWLGFYKGTSHHWSSGPSDTIIVTYHYYKKVTVNVQKGSLESSLNLTITYNDTIIDSKNDLEFSTSGHYFSEWGIGSGYGKLTINFYDSSLQYNSFQKCGIPCDSGIGFTINKIE